MGWVATTMPPLGDVGRPAEERVSTEALHPAKPPLCRRADRCDVVLLQVRAVGFVEAEDVAVREQEPADACAVAG
jgi:hypothetical protein